MKVPRALHFGSDTIVPLRKSHLLKYCILGSRQQGLKHEEDHHRGLFYL